MAQQSFLLQVQGLTNLTISNSGTSPTQAELNDYLVDGVRDVACRILAIKPNEANLFSATDNLTDDNGLEVQSGIVVDVVRADGVSASNLIPADPMTASHRYRATDTDSLHYRSKFNPGYYILNKKVYVVPTPSSGADIAKITYVDYDVGVAHGSATGSISFFPDKYQGLVPLYAACRSLLNAMGNTISSLTAYSAPTISDSGADLTTMTDSSWADLDYDFDDENIDYRTWFQTAGDMIQRQEDLELAGAQIEKINAYLTAYQSALANAGAIFDKNFQKYNTDYQWMADRHQRLWAEYIGYFNTMMGQQQQAQQQAQQQQQAQRGRR